MKQCPRCKSILAKTHGEKMVCRVCGFVTRNLQVARDNQQFQQRHHFGKKITISNKISSHNSSHGQSQYKDHFLVSFQNTLRSTANKLSNIDKQYKNIQIHSRNIWVTYINFAVQAKIDIVGMFRKHLKNNNINDSVKKIKQNEQHQQKKQQQDHQNSAQLQPKQAQSQIQVFLPKKRRGRKKREVSQGQSTHQEKKIPLKLQIRRKLVQLQQNEQDLCLEEQRIKFLQYLISISQKQIDLETIEYISIKYANFLAQSLRIHNLNMGISNAKGIKLKTSHKQLQLMVQMRGLKFTQNLQMQIVLLLQDLLRKWSRSIEIFQDLSLEQLLLLYRSAQNPKQIHLISGIIKNLMMLIRQHQQDSINQKNKYSKILFPQLSVSLIYAIIYIASLMSSCTLTINDIIQKCGKLNILFDNQNIKAEYSINYHKIRKIASLLLRILNIKCEASTNSISRWVAKYASICELNEYSDKIIKLSQVIFQSYELSKRQEQDKFIIDRRYGFLEQDIIAKSIIIIFLKLEIGFQNEPFLTNFPPQMMDRLENGYNRKGQINKKLKILNQVARERETYISVKNIISCLSRYYSPHIKRSVEIKLNCSMSKYSNIEHLSIKNIMNLMKRATNDSSIFECSIAKTYKNKFLKNLNRIKVLKKQNKQSQWELKPEFEQQIQYAMKDIEEKQFNVRELDLPSANYELMHEYMSNVKYIGRQMFVLLAQNLTGRQCRMMQLYEWLEKMQSVLQDFQN